MNIKDFTIGKIIKTKKFKARVSTELIKYKQYYAIYADIIENTNCTGPCYVKKLNEKVALIIRNKEKMINEMGLTSKERTAIYCHELGHCFSINQTKSNERSIEDEVDSDRFAVKECNIDPRILENALAKTYEYEMKKLSTKKDVTQEQLDKFVEEMTARKRNIEKLIKKIENIEL